MRLWLVGGPAEHVATEADTENVEVGASEGGHVPTVAVAAVQHRSRPVRAQRDDRNGRSSDVSSAGELAPVFSAKRHPLSGLALCR